ncbi:MAG: signal peptidase I, partial [Dehalococcoidales bacterium]|nr:signal peptidase I [Dehalococcoidales bacterium]
TMVISSVVPSEELEVGDVIVFRPVSVGEKPIVHRIIEVRNTYPLTFKTQGDAYPEPDQWFVPEDNIIGKLEFSSPFLGYITNFFRSKIGLVITLVLPAVVLVLMILRYIWRELVKYIRNKPMSAS